MCVLRALSREGMPSRVTPRHRVSPGRSAGVWHSVAEAWACTPSDGVLLFVRAVRVISCSALLGTTRGRPKLAPRAWSAESVGTHGFPSSTARLHVMHTLRLCPSYSRLWSLNTRLHLSQPPPEDRTLERRRQTSALTGVSLHTGRNSRWLRVRPAAVF